MLDGGNVYKLQHPFGNAHETHAIMNVLTPVSDPALSNPKTISRVRFLPPDVYVMRLFRSK